MSFNKIQKKSFSQVKQYFSDSNAKEIGEIVVISSYSFQIKLLYIYFIMDSLLKIVIS